MWAIYEIKYSSWGLTKNLTFLFEIFYNTNQTDIRFFPFFYDQPSLNINLSVKGTLK